MSELPISEARRAAEPETAALRRLQVAMGEAQLALGRRMRMNPSDLNALGHVAGSPSPLGPTDLAGRLGMSPAATTELVDRLERAGHLLRERDLTDRRRVRLVPSSSARTEVIERLGGLLEALDRLAADLTDDEREIVRRYLERAAEAYRAYAASDDA